MNFETYCHTEPSLPGKWKCLRAQQGHFGPFFLWANVDNVIQRDNTKCPHCEGDGVIDVESMTRRASVYIDCPWCDGTGKDEVGDSVDEDALVPVAIWCDSFGRQLDAEITIDGWISDRWLMRYEPPRLAA